MVIERSFFSLSCALVLVTAASAQTPTPLGFAKDIQPILRQNCLGCHGPAQQLGGMRLDRRSSALQPGARRIVPGSGANSLLLHRLVGTEYGMQMPPAGPLPKEQIDTLRRWIEEGAVWPDDLANETAPPVINNQAVAIVNSLRLGEWDKVRAAIAADKTLLNARGPEGSSPFMYAVLYAPTTFLEELLKLGADANAHNDAGATPLMWAVTDLNKTRLLVNHGADVNARSAEMRTPLLVAAGRSGNSAVVKLLLEHGAKPDPNPNPGGQSSALIEAATVGDANIMALLISHGASVKAAGTPALSMAISSECRRCLDLLVAGNPDKAAYTGALGEIGGLADARTLRLLLDHGADVNAKDSAGRTPLMYAAGSDLIPLDNVRIMVEHGADWNAKVGHLNSVDTGWSVLDIAQRRGRTPVVDYLVQKGATAGTEPAVDLKFRSTNSIADAIRGSLPLLQRTDSTFTAKTGCISCHNNSLTAMTLASARKAGFPVDESIAKRQVSINAGALGGLRDRMHLGYFVPVEDSFASGVMGYILVGLEAEHYPGDAGTDAAAMYIKSRQTTDGHWAYSSADTRPPLCSSYIGETALAMRGLQLYAPRTDKAAYQKAVNAAAIWIAQAQPKVTDDRSWKVSGLAWAGTNPRALAAAKADLLRVQHSDGGWSDIESLESSAYSTGKALVALQTAGMSTADPAWQRGVQFLLKSQQQDGSWFVRSRALGFQPYFDAGFPHGFNQYISAAGSNWATMALALAAVK